jgi:hypothetical protein
MRLVANKNGVIRESLLCREGDVRGARREGRKTLVAR